MTNSRAINSLSDLQKIAGELACQLNPGDCLYLEGDLGAGKTTFVQYLAKELGITEPVTSPSFNLVNTYKSGATTLHHIDLYRLNSVSLETLDVNRYLEDATAITCIEWASRLNDHSQSVWALHLSLHADGSRSLVLNPPKKIHTTKP